jgi:Transcriptional regulator
MRTEHLQYLVEVARTNSLNKASQNLGLTHQTVNTGIHNLENELGCKLFESNAHGTFLSLEGKATVEFAQKILGDVDRFQQHLKELDRQDATECYRGELSIACCSMVNTYIIPPLIKRFIAEYPKVLLKINKYESLEIPAQISRGGNDLGFLTLLKEEVDKLQQEGVPYKCLFETGVYAIVPINHPLAKRKSVSINTVLKYPLTFCLTDEKSSSFYALISKYGTPKVHLATDNPLIYQQIIASGEAIAFLPKLRPNKIIDLFHSLKLTKVAAAVAIRDLPKLYCICLRRKSETLQQKALVELFIDLMEKTL